MNIKKILIIFLLPFIGLLNVRAQSTNIVGQTVVGVITESAFTSTDPGGFETVTISDSSLTGGNSESDTVAQIIDLDLQVGHGYNDEGLATTIDISNSIFQGGDGGAGTNFQGNVKSFGGNGVNIKRGDNVTYTTDQDPASITINSGIFNGGSGEKVSIFNQQRPTDYDRSLLNIPGARGGHGFRFTRLDQTLPNNSSAPPLYGYDKITRDIIIINDGTFSGGNGGNVLDTANIFTNDTSFLSAQSSLSAQGGSGVLIDYAEVIINDGTFSGGIAGTTNGVFDRAGAGVHVQDSNLTINNGNFTGIGLRVENRYYDSINTINDGTFETIEYISNYDYFFNGLDFYQNGTIFNGTNRTTRANIYGGSISNVILKGTSYDVNLLNNDPPDLKGGKNEIIIHGGNINQITFSSNEFSENRVIINSSANVGKIKVENKSNNSVVFENDILPIYTSLDLGLNSLYITNLTTQAGNMIQSTFSNNDNSLIPNSGKIVSENLNLTAGTQWTLVNSSSNPYTTFQDLVTTNGILLAQANQGSLTYDLNIDDINLVNNTEWLLGINGFTNITENSTDYLYASYGFGQLNEILGATGDLLVISDILQPQIESNDQLRLFIQNQYANANELRSGLTKTYLRTPEVAQTSIGIQSIVLGQISDRIKTYRENQFFGNRISPRGPNGWKEILGFGNNNYEINDSLKNAESRIESRKQFESNIWKINERFEEDIDNNIIPVRKPFASGYVGKGKGYNRFINWLNEVTPKINLENKIPENFQSWGKVFHSNISRDSVDEIEGYDSTISGMVLGLDRKNKNSLFGVYTGFSDTDLSGLGNNDSQIDSFHMGTYWSLISDSIFFDTSLNYSSNNADNNGPVETEYKSSFDFNNLSLSVSSGLNMNFYDKLFVTPEISFLSSSYNRDGYTDSSAVQGLVDKNYLDYKERSSKLEIGSKFLWLELIENLQSKIMFQPEIRISWLHEFNPTFDNEKYTFNGDTNLMEAYLLSQDENLFKTGIGLNFWNLSNYNSNFSFDFDYIKGSSIKEFTLSGSFIYRF